MRFLLGVIALLAVSCASGAAPVTPTPTNGPMSIQTAAPQISIPTASPPPGVCTEVGISNTQLIGRWLDLAGKHDLAGVRDCFAVSYGLPASIADRWANLGAKTNTSINHSVNNPVNGCDWFSVTAEFPYGNPYAPVQDANKMFLAVGVGMDGDRPRIFGTATAVVQRSPDATPHAGPPDCH